MTPRDSTTTARSGCVKRARPGSILAHAATRVGLLTVLVASALAALGPLPLHAQSARSLVEEGNRLYEEGRFQEAHERYMEAMAGAPDSPVIPFNAGNALYQGADYRRAMDAYEQAIASGDPELAGDAWFNLGNALYRQQQLQPSLEAYKQALRLDPADVDAKHNLERVLQQMQQQQQRSPQQDGQEGEEPEQDQQPPEGQDQQPPQQDRQPQGEPDGQAQGQSQDEEGRQEGDAPPPEEQPGEGDEASEPRPGEEPAEGPPDGEAGARPRPGEMTGEEARRLLDAIDEDPEDVNRRQASSRGLRPSKPW